MSQSRTPSFDSGADNTLGRSQRYSDIAPALTAAAAAISSVAFFRPWSVFTYNSGASGRVEFTGAALARELGGRLPWLYVTPALLVLILTISFLRLFRRSVSIARVYGLALVVAGIAIGFWPTRALARMLQHLGRLGAGGDVRMGLTPWWWVYFTSLAITLVFAIIEFLLTLKPRPVRR
ncbi:MAG TPA: hypothetical protein VJX67_11185 [Blastocatellia bacterium]|nr:hypothetical protein [Blastocatellia bacterium]